jgi:hypothetical protein
VTFETIAGCRYRLFTSIDLVNWSPVEPAFYGFGGEYSIHVGTDGPIPPPEQSDPDGEAVAPCIEMHITEFGTTEAVLSFVDSDGAPWQTLVTNPHQTAQEPAFSAIPISGSYLLEDEESPLQFAWLRTTGAWQAGYATLPAPADLPAAAKAEVQAFIAAYPDIVAADPGGIVTQFDPAEARFWRVQEEEPRRPQRLR